MRLSITVASSDTSFLIKIDNVFVGLSLSIHACFVCPPLAMQGRTRACSLCGTGVCRLKELSSIYEYQGEETCAADGMCQVKCPVKINTGDLIKSIRKEQLGQESRASKTAMVCLPV